MGSLHNSENLSLETTQRSGESQTALLPIIQFHRVRRTPIAGYRTAWPMRQRLSGFDIAEREHKIQRRGVGLLELLPMFGMQSLGGILRHPQNVDCQPCCWDRTVPRFSLSIGIEAGRRHEPEHYRWPLAATLREDASQMHKSFQYVLFTVRIRQRETVNQILPY
jgi:hypothetical protein